MANIYDLANELEREIRVLPEYKKAQECRAAIDGDTEAKALFKEFTEFQQGLYAKLQSGQMPTGDEQTKMQELGAKIEANPTLKAYLGAQQSLSVYVSDLEKIIFGPLQDLLK